MTPIQITDLRRFKPNTSGSYTQVSESDLLSVLTDEVLLTELATRHVLKIGKRIGWGGRVERQFISEWLADARFGEAP